ncbi:hypothetical protein RFI_25551, partial [Reticulomyxa filosa]
TDATAQQHVFYGHCVVKLADSNSNNDKDNNQIILLSFGGDKYTKRHTFVMKYVSVWSDGNNNDDENKNENETNKSKKLNEFNQFNELNKSNNYNQWLPFTDNHNHPIIIGRERDHDNYRGARALIGGINNHLLFITYYINNIIVFDLNKFKFIKYDTLPADNFICYHCFVSKSENGQVQEMMKQNYQMLLFCWGTGLSIEYNEDNNTFQFQKLPVCHDIALFNYYAYVCINDVVLFFGGYGRGVVSKLMHSIQLEKTIDDISKNFTQSIERLCCNIE